MRCLDFETATINVLNVHTFQAQAERSVSQEVSSLRDSFCAKKLSVRHTSLSRDDDGARIISELVEVKTITFSW